MADKNDEETLSAYLDASTAMLGIPADPAWRDATLAYFKGMAAAARLVEEFPLPDDAEPAPVFSA